jgi:hypothetical protein
MMELFIKAKRANSRSQEREVLVNINELRLGRRITIDGVEYTPSFSMMSNDWYLTDEKNNQYVVIMPNKII